MCRKGFSENESSSESLFYMKIYSACEIEVINMGYTEV
jgi:hypothetical protein